MRRSTAAAVGTLAGAAMIMGVRLSVTAGPVAAPVAVEQPVDPPPSPGAASGGDRDGDGEDGDSKNGGGKNGDSKGGGAKDDDRQADDDAAEPAPSPSRRAGRGAPASGLKDGQFAGAPATNPFGQVRVSLTVSGGKITAATATYPTAGQSAAINAGAIPKLRQATLAAQSARIDSVSGATFTSEAYQKSLQAALDAAEA